jgi:coenzyme PQQ biosynthesis protein PqqD
MKALSIPKPAFGVFVEEMDGETLLYRLGAHKAIHLNEMAAVIYRLCDGTRTVQEIIDVLRDQYPASEADIPADVTSALDMLAAEGAVLDAATSQAKTSPPAAPA